jgi:hypothetical protein
VRVEEACLTDLRQRGGRKRNRGSGNRVLKEGSKVARSASLARRTEQTQEWRSRGRKQKDGPMVRRRKCSSTHLELQPWKQLRKSRYTEVVRV